MTTEHDFKCLIGQDNYWKFKDGSFTQEEYEAILFALRFTDACLNGEASSDVVISGLKAFQNGYGTPLTRMRFAHESMTQQRATEIQKEID